jgi:hypothetical protein
MRIAIISKKMNCPKNVLRSDFRNLECFLVNTNALSKLLHEHLVNDPVQEVREKIFKSCRDLGLLRCQA